MSLALGFFIFQITGLAEKTTKAPFSHAVLWLWWVWHLSSFPQLRCHLYLLIVSMDKANCTNIKDSQYPESSFKSIPLERLKCWLLQKALQSSFNAHWSLLPNLLLHVKSNQTISKLIVLKLIFIPLLSPPQTSAFHEDRATYELSSLLGTHESSANILVLE